MIKVKPIADNKAKGKKVSSRKKEKNASDKNAVASDTDCGDDTQGAICASCLNTINANCVKVTCTVCDGQCFFSRLFHFSPSFYIVD